MHIMYCFSTQPLVLKLWKRPTMKDTLLLVPISKIKKIKSRQRDKKKVEICLR